MKREMKLAQEGEQDEDIRSHDSLHKYLDPTSKYPLDTH